MKAIFISNTSKKRSLDVYMRALSIEKQKRIKRIILSTSPGEDRWVAIKSYFMSISPKLVDNLFAWNIYKLSI